MNRVGIRDNQVMENKIKKIQYLLTDCDGVLTDGGLYSFGNGKVIKRFSTRDQIGIGRLLEFTGIKTFIIIDEKSIEYRNVAEKLFATRVYVAGKDKFSTLMELIASLDVNPEEIAYIGDEIDDVEIMNAVGFSACPLDAVYEARSAADYVCNSCGGSGVIRELAEYINTARQKLAVR